MEVDYIYYAKQYGGNSIPKERFPWTVQKAEQYLDLFTFGKTENTDYNSQIKNCICDMAETIYKTEKQGEEKIKKSESTDGYSVSYVTEITDGQDAQEVLRKKLYGIAECYLMNTGLLYLGVE